MSTINLRAALSRSPIVMLSLLVVSGCGGDAGEPDSAPVQTTGVEQETMVYFPWPPPRSSALVRIPGDFFVQGDGNSSLGFVAARLERALEQAGYRELQYYAIPGDSFPSGFAMVTPLEQINDDASPKIEPDRWLLGARVSNRTPLWEYLKAAIRGNPGHYRVIVFLTTSRALKDSGTVTQKTVQDWQDGGWNSAPEWLYDLPYTLQHRTVALIYEFSQTSLDSEPEVISSHVRGSAHLYRARIWPALGE